MARLVLRRTGWSILVLLVATILVFVIVRTTTDPLSHLRESTTASSDSGDEGRVVAAERSTMP